MLEEFFLGHEARRERNLDVVEGKVVSRNGRCGENKGEKLIERLINTGKKTGKGIEGLQSPGLKLHLKVWCCCLPTLLQLLH